MAKAPNTLAFKINLEKLVPNNPYLLKYKVFMKLSEEGDILASNVKEIRFKTFSKTPESFSFIALSS